MQKSDIIEFLEEIDSYLESNYRKSLGGSRIEFKIIGKSALLLAGMNDSTGTVDLDLLGVDMISPAKLNESIEADLLAEFGRARILVHTYYLEFVKPAIVFLPQRPTWQPQDGKWKHLRVVYLASTETVASKCFSAFSSPPRGKDRMDITAALDQGLVTISEVIPMADHLFDFYSMDARSDRFPAVCNYINEELIPSYGGGPLTYQSDDN